MHHAPHLVVSISGHGFGHVAQAAPVLNLLHKQHPGIRLTVRSVAPPAHLRSRILVPFEPLHSEGDIGMIMSSPLDVEVELSRNAYRNFHAGWEARIADEALLLRDLQADLVFSNVGYLALAGAQRAGIGNAALCSLNWADIYRHYCDASPDSATGRASDLAIIEQIHASYANADAFLRATPGMAMNDLDNLIPVPPIASIGTNRRDELNRHLGLSDQEKLVLVSMGGIASRIAMEHWPHIEGVRYLVQAGWQIEHPDAIVIESLPMGFADLLASSDALLCKPGYGSFVEAACCGVPVLYVARADWPESSALIEWLSAHAVSLEITYRDLQLGDISCQLEQLWTTCRPEPIVATGAQKVADWLAEKTTCHRPSGRWI